MPYCAVRYCAVVVHLNAFVLFCIALPHHHRSYNNNDSMILAVIQYAISYCGVVSHSPSSSSPGSFPSSTKNFLNSSHSMSRSLPSTAPSSLAETSMSSPAYHSAQTCVSAVLVDVVVDTVAVVSLSFVVLVSWCSSLSLLSFASAAASSGNGRACGSVSHTGGPSLSKRRSSAWQSVFLTRSKYAPNWVFSRCSTADRSYIQGCHVLLG
mmetsp:Transcript_26004/g.56992  ORF Transcript_26004/g.56992 Transcript_26004/m.56992 type:complete len:210 (-) Transcript_26004:270-899(-)